LRGGAVVAAVAVLYLSVLVFPQPFFGHRRAFQGFTVSSDAELPADLEATFRDVDERTRAMELYRDGEHYRIFLCRSQKLYTLFARLVRRRADTQGMVLSLVGNMFLSEPGMRAMRDRAGGSPRHSRFEGSLAGAIAHEVAHLQMTAELGLRRMRAVPFWIQEGYAEYAAYRAPARADPDYNLPDRVRLLLDDEAWSPPLRPVDRRHFRWQLLVTFLCDIRGHRFTDLADSPPTEESTWTDLQSWLATQKLKKGVRPLS
jgi:hypothetical protein